MVLLCGALFVVSALDSGGTDLRPGRYTNLSSLVSDQRRDVKALQAEVRRLKRQVSDLTDSVHDKRVRRLRRRAAELREPAGRTPVTGPAVTVTLSDAPAEVINSTSMDLNLLVVHQQDIQAVVNAMWRGGAQAVTLQGQRIVSTTGIKCAGNSVQLQGVPYPPPYVITGIGDQAQIMRAIEEDATLQVYREQAARPDIAVGWDLTVETTATAPAYEGLLEMQYAEPGAG